MKRKTIRIADGYNGDSVLLFDDPIETDGASVKLQVAEPGRGHMFRWMLKTALDGAKYRRDQRNAARRERDQVCRDMGLKRVRGTLGGIYWE